MASGTIGFETPEEDVYTSPSQKFNDGQFQYQFLSGIFDVNAYGNPGKDLETREFIQLVGLSDYQATDGSNFQFSSLQTYNYKSNGRR